MDSVSSSGPSVPQRLGRAGRRFSAGDAASPGSAPLPPAEAPRASPAAPASAEETKRFMSGIVLNNPNALICVWFRYCRLSDGGVIKRRRHGNHINMVNQVSLAQNR